jgi:putative hydrolase of the HAD superfamily
VVRDVRAVLFDLDMTLLDRDASLVKVLVDQHERLRPYLGHIPQESFVQRFVELDDKGYRTKEFCYGTLIAEFGISGLDEHELTADYRANFQHHCVPFAGLHEMLDGLQAAGYQLGMITNGRFPFQLLNVQALGIEPYFETILVSEKEGCRKPEAEIFGRALGKMSVDAETAVFVGDNPEADVRGAQNVGMRGVWKRTDYWHDCPHANAICERLDEILPIIQQWK